MREIFDTNTQGKMVKQVFDIFHHSKHNLLRVAGVFLTIISFNSLEAQVQSEAQCIETDNIASYKIETDDIVKFLMTDGSYVEMRLKHSCPQLRFHGYLSYTPMNGQLCAGADEIKTRAGLPCRIQSFETKETTPPK